MDAAGFHRRIDETLERVVRGLQTVDEVEYTASDGLVGIEFDDGSRWVLNRQGGNRQLWLAAGARAWHYDWDAATGTWRDDRDGHDFWDHLAALLSEKLGRTIRL